MTRPTRKKKQRHRAILYKIIEKSEHDGIHSQDLYQRYFEVVADTDTHPSGRDEEPYSKRYLEDLVTELEDDERIISEIESRGRGGFGKRFWVTTFVSARDFDDWEPDV
jgi:Cdc6-like AAA superfamily ATPase